MIRTEISSLPTNANGRRTIIESHIDANTAALEAGLLGVGQSIFSASGLIGTPSYAVTGMDLDTNFVAGVSAERGTLAVVSAQMVTVPQNDIWYRVAIRPDGDPVEYAFFDQSTNQMLAHSLKGLPYKIVLIEGDNTNPPPCPSDYVDYGTIFATGGIANFTLSPARAILAPNSPWANILGTPTTLAGYGITDAYTNTQTDTLLAAIPWPNITGKPTTLGGYGITDAYTNTQTDTLLAGKTPINTLVGQTQYNAGTSLDGIYFNTSAGVAMWSLIMNGTPSGATAPSLELRRHDAAGVPIAGPSNLIFNRATGYSFQTVSPTAPFFASFFDGVASVMLGKNTNFNIAGGSFNITSAIISAQTTGNILMQSTGGIINITGSTGLNIGTSGASAITNFNGSIVRFNVTDQLDFAMGANTIRIRPTYTEFTTIGGYGGTMDATVSTGGTVTIPNTNTRAHIDITVTTAGAAAITVDLSGRADSDGALQFIRFRGNFTTLTVTWANATVSWADNLTPPTTYANGDSVYLRVDTTNIYAARRARWSVVSVYRATPSGSTGSTQTITATVGPVNITAGTTFARFTGASFTGDVVLPLGVADRTVLHVAFGTTGNGAGYGSIIWTNAFSTYNVPSGVFDGSAITFIFDFFSGKWRCVGAV